ncbi:hypothetical protein RIF29_20932 [Crotalaria pallida]|uniref:Uncharacterized protein n=1 Tax=Crotalaria pallida TaxID=3830 RepID=A0AAN9I6S1_CROPI
MSDLREESSPLETPEEVIAENENEVQGDPYARTIEIKGMDDVGATDFSKGHTRKSCPMAAEVEKFKKGRSAPNAYMDGDDYSMINDALFLSWSTNGLLLSRY